MKALRLKGVKRGVKVDASASILDAVCKAKGWKVPVREYRFAAPRRWRFDFCWPEQYLAIEVEGGAFIQGRHTRGVGFVKDMEKYSEAAVRGWAVIRVTPSQLLSPATMDWIQRGLTRAA